ncbi:hypothetical protein BGX27_009528 [Mortierella sp. AM989]|nr:hypothetical protein BGX27_009528 [Mortierella sp. AM989]
MNLGIFDQASTDSGVSTPSTDALLGSTPTLSTENSSLSSHVEYDNGTGVGNGLRRSPRSYSRFRPTILRNQYELESSESDVESDNGPICARITRYSKEYSDRSTVATTEVDAVCSKPDEIDIHQIEQQAAAADTEHCVENPADATNGAAPGSQAHELLNEETTTDKGGRKLRNSFRKIFKSAKQTLKDVWANDSNDISGVRWIYRPEITEPSDNPFFKVNSSVRFQDVVPERPSMFPYPSQIMYSSRYGTSVIPSDPKIAGGQAHREDEARVRERLVRQTLMRRKSSGKYRRLPNITLSMTEGRVNEPVEVARIRRAYTNPKSQQQTGSVIEGGKEPDTLLEKMNRQARARTVEWTVVNAKEDTGEQEPQSTSSAPVKNMIIKLPSQGNELKSRKSLTRTVSTRFPGQPRHGNVPPVPKSVFMAPIKEPVNSKRERRPRYFSSRAPRFGGNIAAKMEHTIAFDQSKGMSMLPEVVITSCQNIAPELESSTAATNISWLSANASDSPLLPPRPLFHRQEAMRGSVEESRSSDSGNESDRLSIEDKTMKRGASSNCSSVQSSHSASSNMSAVSSIANSVYSSLSEDWNRPVYYAKSKSPRYPDSMQTEIRVLPPLANLKVSIKSELISEVETSSQMDFVAEMIRSRNLRYQDGSPIILVKGDQLGQVEYRVLLEPIKEDDLEKFRDRDPAASFARSCKSAKPTATDALGFIEYGEESKSEFNAGKSNTAHVGNYSTEYSNGSTMVDRGRIFDLNDTRRMISSGINPSDPHPDPKAFYKKHYLHYLKHNCLCDGSIDHIPEEDKGELGGSEEDDSELDELELGEGGFEHEELTEDEIEAKEPIECTTHSLQTGSNIHYDTRYVHFQTQHRFRNGPMRSTLKKDETEVEEVTTSTANLSPAVDSAQQALQLAQMQSTVDQLGPTHKSKKILKRVYQKIKTLVRGGKSASSTLLTKDLKGKGKDKEIKGKSSSMTDKMRQKVLMEKNECPPSSIE